MSALPPDAVDRFRRDFEQTLGRPAASERIALAVSGGPDSMAMLALAAAAYPAAVIAATVDHGLRAAAADEARLVADWCAAHGIAHSILQLAKPLAKTGVQANARAARYDLLAHWALEQGAALLATAHHADDQAETFLMRAVRGAGPSGLAGVRQSRPLVPGVTLVRPLLGWRVAELRQLVCQGGIPFADDPSNVDPQFERVRLRRLLAENDWLDAAHLAQAARNAAEAAEAIDEFAAWLQRSRRITPVGVAHPDAERWVDMSDLPRELVRRLARAAIHDVRRIGTIVRPKFDDATNIEPLLAALAAGSAATQAGVLVSCKGTIWRFRAAPPRRSS